jgi:hypothetical protein
MALGNRERWAQIGIVIQFLALLRCLAEVFRLQALRGAELQIPEIRPFVTAATIAAVLGLVAVLLYFMRRFSGVLGVAALTFVAMLVYKFRLHVLKTVDSS